jgi:bifunctional oligoribonuclease and PAP phosphatase NrnA
MELNDKYKLAGEKIKGAKNIIVIGHINPDGDALASICALKLIANANQINSTGCGLFKKSTFFLPGEEEIITDIEAIPKLESFDVVIVVDCGSLSRTGLESEIIKIISKPLAFRPYIIEFDHHPKIDNYSDLEIRLPEKAATAEIIYEFLKINHWLMTKEIANCILTGLLTDTGNFLYPNVSDQTILAGSEALQAGAQFPKIIDVIMHNKNLLMMKLWGKAMDNLRLNKKYNIAFSAMSYQEIKTISNSLGIEDITSLGDVFGDIAGFLSNLSDVKAIMLLREEEEGKIKGSLRTSQAKVDISPLAKLLGGGGHPKASGFSLAGHLVTTNSGWEIID